MASFDRDTKCNEVTVLKRVDASLGGGYELFEDFSSSEVVSQFVEVAYRALAVFDYTSVDPCMYVEGPTEDSQDQQPTIWAKPGIVTCKLKFKWLVLQAACDYRRFGPGYTGTRVA